MTRWNLICTVPKTANPLALAREALSEAFYYDGQLRGILEPVYDVQRVVLVGVPPGLEYCPGDCFDVSYFDTGVFYVVIIVRCTRWWMMVAVIVGLGVAVEVDVPSEVVGRIRVVDVVVVFSRPSHVESTSCVVTNPVVEDDREFTGIDIVVEFSCRQRFLRLGDVANVEQGFPIDHSSEAVGLISIVERCHLCRHGFSDVVFCLIQRKGDLCEA